MGVARQVILLLEVIAWGFYVVGVFLAAPIEVSVGGGLFPQPAVSGLQQLPFRNLAAATAALVVVMIITESKLP